MWKINKKGLFSTIDQINKQNSKKTVVLIKFDSMKEANDASHDVADQCLLCIQDTLISLNLKSLDIYNQIKVTHAFWKISDSFTYLHIVIFSFFLQVISRLLLFYFCKVFATLLRSQCICI